MPDDKTTRNSPDNKRIDLNDSDEIRNWTKSLGVTEEQLREVVTRVGTSAGKVREYLRK